MLLSICVGKVFYGNGLIVLLYNVCFLEEIKLIYW